MKMKAENTAMQPKIEIFLEKKMVCRRILMSLTNDKTIELWQSFMPRRKEIKNAIGSELYAIRVYGSSYFNNFTFDAAFENRAAVKVTDFDSVPDDMESFILPAGLYAVFMHQGPASLGQKTIRYIFDVWLPDSEYELDDRPHIAVMGEKYKNEDPDSEEEICIPIRLKK